MNLTRRWRGSLVLILSSWTLCAQAPFSAELRGDAAWARRAEGFLRTGRVAEGPAREAVEAFEEALAADPDDLALRFKLLEALYFLGHFATSKPNDAKRVFDRQLHVAQEAVEQVERRIGDPGRLEQLSTEERAQRLAAVPEAKEAYFWQAMSWGLWAMSHSLLASAAKGVPGKIRDDARLVTLLDERFAGAAGLRLLGCLHTKIPRVPMFSSWVDPGKGIALLRRAHEISPHDPRNSLFLAEALLEHEPGSQAEALTLLREIARHTPDPENLIEQTEILEAARRRLAAFERRPDPLGPRAAGLGASALSHDERGLP